MWIRTTLGNYVNADNVLNVRLAELKSGDWSIIAGVQNNAEYVTLGIFRSKEDAQLYLDKMMAAVAGRIFKLDMGEWNYSGHKKDHKETRRGGS